MKKVDNLEADPNATIELKGRVSNIVNKNIKVSELWNAFTESA